jgi:glucokinase
MILGIDVGGTSTKLGTVEHGRVVQRGRIPSTGHRDEAAFADAIAAEARRLCAQGPALQAIGVGAPNGNQHTGCIEQAANLPWKGIIPLAQMLQERLGVPCILGNDANAAALGEWRYGCGKESSDMLMVTLGTGLGSGFIIDGRLLIGPFGNAGELGHITLVIDGRACGCGRSGCLETYVNIAGIRRTYGEACAEAGKEALLLAEEGVLPIARAASAGDTPALLTFERTARYLAVGLANAVSITSPRQIVLFGGIARSGDLLMEPLRRYFEPALLNVFQRRIELRLSELPDDDAGILGAAALTTL